MRTLQHRTKAGRRGSALALSLVVVSAVALLSATMLQLSSSYWRREAAAVDQKRAFYIAEAGLAEAIHGILRGNSGLVGSPEAPARFGEGVFWTEAIADAWGIIHIASTALCGQARSKLTIAIEVTGAPAFGVGAFGAGNLIVGAGSYIDTFDSRQGRYRAPAAGETPNSQGQVGSNGNITVEAARLFSPAKVYANLVPGPEGSVTLGVGTVVGGETTPRRNKFELPPIEWPTVTRTGSVNQLVGSGTVVSGTYGMASYSVAAGATSTIRGPAILQIDSLSIAPLGRLRIDSTDGPVEIYIKNSFSAPATSVFENVNEDPRGLQLFIGPNAANSVTFAPTGAFHGSIYAPDSRILIAAATPFYGAVVANELEVARNGRLHIDVAAGMVGAAATSLDVLSWRHVQVPRELASDLRYDPVRDFESRGVALPIPADAHEPIEVAVQFRDENGAEFVYRGPEARRPMSLGEVLREVEALSTSAVPPIGTLRSWSEVDSEDAALLSAVRNVPTTLVRR
jgi:hypothetical protein